MYRITDKKLWKGRTDKIDGLEGLRWHQIVEFGNITEHNLPKLSEKQVGFAIVGFRSDEGIRRNQGRIGAIEGANSLRQSVANLPCHFASDTLLVDTGDVFCLGKFLENAQEGLGSNVSYLLERNYIPIVFGGGHETAYGTFLGVRSYTRRRNLKLGIINIDAHFDLRDYQEVGHSGTAFLQMANLLKHDGAEFNYLALGIQKASNSPKSYKTARELNTTYVEAREMTMFHLEKLTKTLETFIEGKDAIYLSIDMDVFSAAYAPGVSAVNGGGISPDIGFEVVRTIAASKKLVAFDIAELAPQYDVDRKTAKLASHLVFHIADAIPLKR
jgi:formiminoglutamase